MASKGRGTIEKKTFIKGDDQPDLFAALYADIPTRDSRECMERPFFSLSKRPRFKPIDYKVGDVFVKVTANSEYGMASIWDADILIWAASQLREAVDRGETPSRSMKFHPYNLLKAVRRGTGKREYKLLRGSLRRLASTYIETNIRAKGKRKHADFHWLEDWGWVENDKDGKPEMMAMTLPQWFFDGVVKHGGVLSIDEDYFLLKGGIERWFYRVARKHAGDQEVGWRFTMRQLYEKSGSLARFSDFAIDIRKIVKADKLPGIHLTLVKNKDGAEVITMTGRHVLTFDHPAYKARKPPRRKLMAAV